MNGEEQTAEDGQKTIYVEDNADEEKNKRRCQRVQENIDQMVPEIRVGESASHRRR